VLIIRRSNYTNTASGIVTLCKWPSGAPGGLLQRVTIPDAVSIKFDLLMDEHDVARNMKMTVINVL